MGDWTCIQIGWSHMFGAFIREKEITFNRESCSFRSWNENPLLIHNYLIFFLFFYEFWIILKSSSNCVAVNRLHMIHISFSLFLDVFCKSSRIYASDNPKCLHPILLFFYMHKCWKKKVVTKLQQFFKYFCCEFDLWTFF